MKTYKKIDLFFAGDYLCSTNQSRTCKEAVNKYLDSVRHHKSQLNLVDQRIKKNPTLLKARFDRRLR